MFHNPVYAASPTDPPSLAGTVPGTRPAAKGVAAEQALKPLWRLSAGAADAESCTDNSTPTSLLRVRRQSTAMRVVLVALILATVGIVLGAAALAVAAADKSNSKRLAALEQEILVNNDAASALEQRLSASEAGLAGLKQRCGMGRNFILMCLSWTNRFFSLM